MMRMGFEQMALQAAVALGSLVPIGAGLGGILLGPRLLGPSSVSSADLDSHFRYLSGLLLAIGLGFVSTIPGIATHERRFRLLTGIVVIGGIGRLVPALLAGAPSAITIAALAMELLVTPGLALWQRRIAREGRS